MSGNQFAGAGSGAAAGASAGSAGGPWGAAIGGVVGAVAGAVGGSAADRSQAKSLKTLKNALIKPKLLPTPNDAAVQAAKDNEIRALQSQSGRASTLLSGTQGTKTTFGS